MVSNTTRTADHIVITVHQQPDCPPVPFELLGHVSPETWEFRFHQITALCSQYSKPLLERIWFLISVLTTLILPVVLYGVIVKAITPKSILDALDREENGQPGQNRFDGNAREAISKYLFEARGITFGILVGIVLVFWGPLILWKRMGTIRANALTRQWAVEDGLRGLAFVPRWTVRTPGIFNIAGRVTITTPLIAPPSLFHPFAYLPPYLAQGGDPFQGGYPDWKAPPYTMPPMPGVVAVQGDEKRRDEFEDVKV